MEYFNIDKYKDWEIDTEYSSDEITKFLKKDSERIKMIFSDKSIQIKQTNIKNPYALTKVYYFKNKLLKSILYKFYSIEIKTYRKYSEIGVIIIEEDLESPYKFSLKEVIEKVKKEYGIDLEDLTQRCVLERFESVELDKKPLYTAYLRNENIAGIMDYIVIDGNTGETLFKTDVALNGDRDLPPYYKYMESLKKAKEEGDEYFTTYKGKKYTKREWEVYEEEWYKNHQNKKKSKGFWDDLFNRP